MDKELKRNIVMMVSVIATVFFALVLEIVDINLPFLPEFTSIRFSAIFELLGAIAFGPFVGVGVVVAKSFFYLWIMGCTVADIIGNGITDCVFVFVAGIIFYTMRGGVVKKTNKKGEAVKKIVTRKKKVLISGACACVIATVVSFFVFGFVSIPLMVRYNGTTQSEMFSAYLQTSSNLKNIYSGVALINVPIALFEYVVATVVVAFTYKPLSYYMHGRFVS